MKTYKILLLIILLLSACRKDIPLGELLENKRQLVLVGFPNTLSKVAFGVYLSDIPQNIDSSDLLLPDAQVFLYKNGQKVQQLTFDTSGVSQGLSPIYVSDYVPEEQGKYTVVANYNNFSAQADFQFPPAVKLLRVKAQKDTTHLGFTALYKIEVSFDDPDTVNYYTFIGYFWGKVLDIRETENGLDTAVIYGRHFFTLFRKNSESDQFSFNFHRSVRAWLLLDKQLFNTEVISDLTFNGRQVTLEFYAYLPEVIPNWDSTINIALFTLSNEAYRYFRSLLLYYRYNDNPFVEPVNVYTNVKGGLGAVVTMNVDTLGAPVRQQQVMP